MWIWQRPAWPAFDYDADRLAPAITEYRLRAERLAGRLAPNEKFRNWDG